MNEAVDVEAVAKLYVEMNRRSTENWSFYELHPEEKAAILGNMRALLAAGLVGLTRAWWCAYEATAWAESEPKCDGNHIYYRNECGWAFVLPWVKE